MWTYFYFKGGLEDQVPAGSRWGFHRWKKSTGGNLLKYHGCFVPGLLGQVYMLWLGSPSQENSFSESPSQVNKYCSHGWCPMWSAMEKREYLVLPRMTNPQLSEVSYHFIPNWPKFHKKNDMFCSHCLKDLYMYPCGTFFDPATTTVAGVFFLGQATGVQPEACNKVPKFTKSMEVLRGLAQGRRLFRGGAAFTSPSNESMKGAPFNILGKLAYLPTWMVDVHGKLRMEH